MSKIFKKEIAKIKKITIKIRKLKKKTPFYIYDSEEARQNLRTFKKAFNGCSMDINVFFAVKSNPYIGLLKTIVKEESGLDVSSQRELRLAIEARAKKIIYTGPAKTEDDFKLILQNHSKITVNLESVRELKLISKMAGKQKKTVRCGVRIFTKNQSGWTKFGIPLNKLRDFYNEAKKLKNINFCGVHFHISFNKTAASYVATIKELTDYLKEHFTKKELLSFEYIDIGGGFYPQTLEGVYPWNPDQMVDFGVNDKLFKNILEDKISPRFIPEESSHITAFAKDISKSYKEIILPLMPNVKLYAEPGRYISHSVMHLVLKIIDFRNEKIGITDGGNNMIGWEKYEFCNYVPIFNLSQFTYRREIPFIMYGPLCTPDDIWGYYMYTKGQPKEGDIICLPFQGAYTYTLAQNFIKDIPPIYDID